MLVHVDTSAIGSTVIDYEERREAARQALAGEEVYLCGYVVQELRATFLRDAALLHRLVHDTSSPEEALLRLRKYGLTEREARAKDIFAHAIGAMFADGRAELTKTALLDVLELLLDGELMRKFRQGLSIREHDTVSCTRADEVGTREGKYYNERFRCKHPNCTLTRLLSRQQQKLSMAAGSDELSQRIREAASQGVREPESIRTSTCWGTLSDLIIALECPEDAVICTTNIGHFRPICSALGMDAPIDANPQY